MKRLSLAMAGVAMHISYKAVLSDETIFRTGGDPVGVTGFAEAKDEAVTGPRGRSELRITPYRGNASLE